MPDTPLIDGSPASAVEGSVHHEVPLAVECEEQGSLFPAYGATGGQAKTPAHGVDLSDVVALRLKDECHLYVG